MPLFPLVLVPVLLYAAGRGVESAYEGHQTLKEAKEINEAAISKYEEERKLLEKADKIRLNSERKLGAARETVFDVAIPSFIEMVARLRNADEVAAVATEAFQADEIPASEMKKVALKQLELLGPASGGAIVAAGASSAAVAGVGAFGAASTGTAISTLSGAAATNATLAWFGGGALAAGGGGMAAGTMVIGGIFAAPALLVGGLVFSTMMDTKLENAEENADEVDEYAAKARSQRLLLDSVTKCCRRGAGLITICAERLTKWTEDLNRIADETTDIKAWDDDQKQLLMGASNLAGLLVGASSVPHVTKNGRLNKGFLQAVDRLDD